MRVCIVHNSYARPSGEEIVVSSTRRVLEEHGHDVCMLQRSSAEIDRMRLGRVRAFFSGICSRSSRHAMRRLIEEHRPDVVHVHNVYPLISPSVLTECRRAGVPAVMTVHNHRLVCPNGLLSSHGEMCERCLGGREYWCVLRNCEGHLLKSLGYALRSAIARQRRLFLDGVTLFAVLSPFQRERLIESGFPAERIVVIPNMVCSEGAKPALGDYVAYAGRVSPEKGVETLVAAAARCPDIPFKIAGSLDRTPHLTSEAPDNVTFLGHLKGARLSAFYDDCRMVIVPSVCAEAFPMAVLEAMSHGKPVVASSVGGLPSIVDDGVTGLLVEPADAAELADKIRVLWERPDLCRRMGEAGRAEALSEYSPEQHYERLMAAYDRAGALAAARTTTQMGRRRTPHLETSR
ncbi:MAG: glycosyltransferase family 4 protein [Verrucomicrobia bacterium]|nr:glycosyltransferase family 4 protein [Verrucomicrobiota bacterium]